MCEFLIFNTQKKDEKQKNFGNFSATFWHHLDTFIGNLWLGLITSMITDLIKSILK